MTIFGPFLTHFLTHFWTGSGPVLARIWLQPYRNLGVPSKRGSKKGSKNDHFLDHFWAIFDPFFDHFLTPSGQVLTRIYNDALSNLGVLDQVLAGTCSKRDPIFGPKVVKNSDFGPLF